MSVTTTANHTRAILRVLDDYEIHHGESDSGSAAPVNARPDYESRSTPHSNPTSWPTRHRDVPPHKAINRNLDMAIRPGGANIVEQMFIFTLLNGVRINADFNLLWRATGGRLNDRIFRYEIGGEW